MSLLYLFNPFLDKSLNILSFSPNINCIVPSFPSSRNFFFLFLFYIISLPISQKKSQCSMQSIPYYFTTLFSQYLPISFSLYHLLIYFIFLNHNQLTFHSHLSAVSLSLSFKSSQFSSFSVQFFSISKYQQVPPHLSLISISFFYIIIQIPPLPPATFLPHFLSYHFQNPPTFFSNLSPAIYILLYHCPFFFRVILIIILHSHFCLTAVLLSFHSCYSFTFLFNLYVILFFIWPASLHFQLSIIYVYYK